MHNSAASRHLCNRSIRRHVTQNKMYMDVWLPFAETNEGKNNFIVGRYIIMIIIRKVRTSNVK